MLDTPVEETLADDVPSKPGGALQRRLRAALQLPKAEVLRLSNLETRSVASARGDVLVVQGGPYDRAGVLLDGWAVKLRYLSDGRRQILDFLLPGSLIAPQALLFDISDHSVNMLTAGVIVLLPIETWADTLLAAPRLAVALIWIQQCDEALAIERLASLGQRNARERIAHMLVELWLRGRAVGLFENACMVLPVTQAMLGDALGLSTVHVNRSMQSLRRDGLLRQGRGSVKLCDLDGLRRVAAFDDDYLYLRPVSGALWRRLGQELETPATLEGPSTA